MLIQQTVQRLQMDSSHSYISLNIFVAWQLGMSDFNFLQILFKHFISNSDINCSRKQQTELRPEIKVVMLWYKPFSVLHQHLLTKQSFHLTEHRK